jgi:hypothetical protein
MPGLIKNVNMTGIVLLIRHGSGFE